jgi:hypothetical protein
MTMTPDYGLSYQRAQRNKLTRRAHMKALHFINGLRLMLKPYVEEARQFRADIRTVRGWFKSPKKPRHVFDLTTEQRMVYAEILRQNR